MTFLAGYGKPEEPLVATVPASSLRPGQRFVPYGDLEFVYTVAEEPRTEWGTVYVSVLEEDFPVTYVDTQHVRVI